MPTPPSRSSLSGLYLILDESFSLSCSLRDVLKQAGETGVQLVQYRDKHASLNEAYQRAKSYRELAGTLGMTFIVNDRCDLAKAVDADGVHLGQDDLPLAAARAVMGSDYLIGISTHREDDVVKATMGGADYLGFGPIYGTTTKKNHEPLVGLEGLQRVRSLTTLPIFAIGGITPQTVSQLHAAGADGVAVASAILNARNVHAIVRQFISAFE
ncbi:MAG: thiamine-phosphate synthase [Nitrospirales bacterium]|nr:MAG: thiamine-phosphate synthase [Nitrospirales bacterium]